MDGFTILFAFGIGLLLLYRFISTYTEKSGLPGPTKYPFVGSALQLKKGQIHTQFHKFAREYGDVFEIKLFNTTNILLNTAEIANKALCADGYKQVFNDRPSVYIADYIYRRTGITFRNQDKLHGELRKALSKGLHVYGDGIQKFEAIVKEEIHQVLQEIEKLKGRDFEVVSLIKRSLCNIISILLIGERAIDTDVKHIFDILEGQDFFMEHLVNTTLLTLPFFVYLPFFKKHFDKVMLARRYITEKYFYKMKESRKPGEIRGLVDWYIQEQEKGELKSLVSDDVIMATILEIVTAGLLTTANVLPTAILCLMHYPGYQTKVQEELDKVVGGDREPTVCDKHDCHFLEAFVLETMRYKPPGPLTLPRVCTKDTNFEGYKVKAGTQVLMNLWAIHHDEKVWGDPWVFRPERFLDEHGKLLPNDHVHMKSWQNFGVGRRKCPGMTLATTRIFLYLSCLFQKYKCFPSPGKCGSCDPLGDDFECGLNMSPKPFYCIAKPRS